MQGTSILIPLDGIALDELQHRRSPDEPHPPYPTGLLDQGRPDSPSFDLLVPERSGASVVVFAVWETVPHRIVMFIRAISTHAAILHPTRGDNTVLSTAVG